MFIPASRASTGDMCFVPDPLNLSNKVEVLRNSNLYGNENPFRRGKVRDVYDLGDRMLSMTTNRISTFDVVYPTHIPHKGESLHALLEFWLSKMGDIFTNNFVKSVDSRPMMVVKTERIDIEWVCRAYLYSSAWRGYRYGSRVVSGVRLPNNLAIVEEIPEVGLTPTSKSEEGHDCELTRLEAIGAGLVTRTEWLELEDATHRLFEYNNLVARRRGFIIPDFKLEFGRVGENLIKIYEPLTHDSARLSRKFYEPGKEQEVNCIDKEFLRECLRRNGYTGDGPPPHIPGPVVQEVSKRCVASYKVLSGSRTVDEFDLKNVDEVIKELST